MLGINYFSWKLPHKLRKNMVYGAFEGAESNGAKIEAIGGELNKLEWEIISRLENENVAIPQK